MIDKFKKGGQNQNKGILAKIQLLPKEQLQQIIQAFSQWALLKGVDIQLLLKDPNALEEALGQFMQELQQQQTKAARHGAKLNYLKSLKNKCAEDEELVYFKKGGSIDCGCKKKEIGGPIKKDNSLDARNKFIARYRSKKEQARIDSLSEADYFNPNKKTEESSDRRTAEQKMPDSLKKKIIKKSCGGSAISKFKAKCGSKLKKHQLGGSLNSIPFMQTGGSFKQAWNEARKNKVRYFNYNGKMYNSKAAGIDNEYNTFRDNMNEMSALLPTDNSPKHLGWEKNNPLSNELRGNDRQVMVQGTESTLPEVTITGQIRTKSKPNKKVSDRIFVRNTGKTYIRGIAQSFPGYRHNLNGEGLYLLGNNIVRRSMKNGKYFDQNVGIIYNGQQYYDENLYKNSNDSDEIVTYDEYRKFSAPSKNKFMGRDSWTGGISPKELPTTNQMKNVGWFKNYKFGKLKNGGSLNGIPFMQKGTNKKGLQWKTTYPPDYIENGLPKYIKKPNYIEDWKGDKKYLVNPYSGRLMTPSEDYLVRDIEEAIEEGKPMGGYDVTYDLKDDYHHNDPRIKVSGFIADLVENRGLGYIPGTEWDDMGRRLVYNWQKKKDIKPKFLYSR